MNKNTKRIHKVTIKRMVDDSPDTSWLGEYSSSPTSEFSIDRAHAEDCQSVNPNNAEAETCLQNAIYHLANSEYVPAFVDDVDEATDVLQERLEELEVCDCGERGDMERNQYRYFNPSFNYVDKQGHATDSLTPEEVRQYTRQDYERMESLNRGDWCFVGIRAEAGVSLSGDGTVYLTQRIRSGGLWGIESDSDDSYFAEVEAEELASLREQLRAIGFSTRAISAAFKTVEREED